MQTPVLMPEMSWNITAMAIMNQASSRAAELTDTGQITASIRLFTGTTQIIHAAQGDAQVPRRRNSWIHACMDAQMERAIRYRIHAQILTEDIIRLLRELYQDTLIRTHTIIQIIATALF